MRKQYINPQTEVLTLAGVSNLLTNLGASGDVHSGTSTTQTGPQSGNRVKVF